MSPLRRYLLLAVLLAAFGLQLSGKGYPMLHYTIENGLPSNTVYDGCLDREKNLWLCTDKGIARFNGITFETFNTNDGLADNEIFNILPDYEGRLWMSSYNGKLCYYYNGRFFNETNAPFLRLPFKLSMVIRMNLESDSSMTYAFLSQTAFVNIKNSRLTTYSLEKINQRYPGEEIRNVVKRAADSFDIFYAKRKLVADRHMDIIDSVVFPKPHRYETAPAGNQPGYIVTKEGVWNTNGKQLKQLHPDFWKKGMAINQVLKDEDNLFVATRLGLYINEEPPLFENYSVAHIRKDGMGGYVICTLNNGIYVLDKHFRQTSLDQAYTGIARSAASYSGRLFIGTHNKNIFELQDGRSRILFNSRQHIPTSEKTGYTFHNNICYGLGGYPNFKVCNLPEAPEVRKAGIIKNFFVMNLYFVKRQMILVSNFSIFSFDYRDERIDTMAIRDTLVNSNFRIAASALAPDSNVWYATVEGVFRLHNTVREYQPQFGHTHFRSFIISGRYLVGYTTTNELLICKDFESGHMIVDTVKGQDCIWENLFPIDNANWIVSTNRQYRLLELSDAGYRIRTIDYPLAPTGAEYICTDSQNCYFMKEGYVTTIPLKVLLAPVPPPLVTFTTLETKQQGIFMDHEVYLTYSDAHYINVHFATPSFYRNITCEYTVTRKGEPDNWQPIEGRLINLYNLSYGDWELKVRAHTDGSAYSVPALIKLHITRPYWATVWFWLPISTIGVLLVAIIIHYRVKKGLVRKEAAYKNELRFLRAEYKAMNALMNPHFIFNAMNSVQSLINTNDKISASEYLRTFSDLIRHNMHHISHELVTLEQEMDITENYLYLEKLRFGNKLDYTIHIDEDIDLDDITVPPLLVQPLVENAVKHGLFRKGDKSNRIQVRIFLRQGTLHIEVEDNGVGINIAREQRKQSHTSFGTDNIRKRLGQLNQLHGSSIQFDIADQKDDKGYVTGAKATIRLKPSV